jgi:hypothetical protein
VILKAICCEVLYREICLLAAQSPHTCDLEFLPKGLHDLGVERMRARLQERIDAVPPGRYEAIVLVYGLCNNGVVGLHSPHTRLVLPRAHDCIALFMGSRRRYRDYFNAHPGTYYKTTGWIERDDPAGAGEDGVSQKLGLFMKREELIGKYGEENADYILETMGDGLSNYNRMVYIRMGLDCEAPFAERARREAAQKGWEFEEVEGSLQLLRKLLAGVWDREDFLTLAPGESVQPSHDEDVCKAQSAVCRESAGTT